MAESETDAPERVWISYPVEFKSLISKGGPAFDNDIEYVRVDHAPNTRQRAERAARKIVEQSDIGVAFQAKVATIIAAEFEN